MNYVVSYRSLLHTVKTFRFILCLAVLLSVSPLMQAQVDEEVDTTAAVEAPPVEEDNYEEKISAILTPPELRQVPDSTVQDLQQKKDFAYANDPEYWAREPERQVETRHSSRKGFWSHFNDFFSGKVVQTFTYIILIAFFLFVIYRIVVVNEFLFSSSTKKVKAADTGEAVDIDDDNLDEKIQQAVAAKDHRMAVRYMYLKALQLLNAKQWIRYHADATNYEYVNQMSRHKLASEFGFLTRVYDYVWYGEFTVTEEQFDIVYKNFSHFYNALHS